MRQINNTRVILVTALSLSLLANGFLLIRIAILKSEYSWLRNTYATLVMHANMSEGALSAQIQHLKGEPREYLFGSASPTMGIAVENLGFIKLPNKTRITDTIWQLTLRVFDKSYKPEPERLWQVNLLNRATEARAMEHNAMLTSLRSEKP